jgi:2,4-dienoyl-CoA reductase-like NADH-dependent reductase (Old Yellow Enzyme family)
MPSKLFSTFKLRELQIRNRIGVSPMCMYSAKDGVPNSWHLVHLGSRAVGGAGLVIVEATGVSPEGRISPGCLGLWNESQMNAMKPIVSFIKDQGAVAGIQLAHAGRKASHDLAWKGGGSLSLSDGGWTTVAPSAISFSADEPKPLALDIDGIKKIIQDFKAATERALHAGFQVIELHMAHGYLMHEFLSPLSNLRSDEFGGSLENRMRLPLNIVEEVRKIIPNTLPLFVRISATDWADAGWDLEQSIQFAKELKKRGVDLIDCSSGGLVEYQKIPAGPEYQVPFSSEIRRRADLPTAAVGLITDPFSAENILKLGNADLILLGREELRDPHWPLHAAKKLGVEIQWPVQYERAKI